MLIIDGNDVRADGQNPPTLTSLTAAQDHLKAPVSTGGVSTPEPTSEHFLLNAR